MAPWWVRLSRRYRWRQLHRKQQIAALRVENAETLQQLVREGCGVLLTPNHSAHYDSAALYIAGDRIDTPLYFMTAWQVFAMSTPFEVWAMQHMGCFSIDREGTDRQALKQAIQIVRDHAYPLVVFPEGDIYHTTDRVTAFREGAAAIALSAARQAERRVVVLPCGIKFWYLEDPTQHMLQTLAEIEQRLYLRVDPTMPLVARIHRVAEAALALKELDYLGRTSSGRLRYRIGALLESILGQLEARHALAPGAADPPERAKNLRQHLIRELQRVRQQAASNGEYERLCAEMGDVFLALQLYSYPGEYLVDDPSIERLAETVDKFEEDILQRDLPSVRAPREIQIRFGEPIEVAPSKNRRGRTAELTVQMQSRVQALIDQMNRDRNGG